MHGKYNEFSNFILNYDVICLQETWLTHRDFLEIGGFETLRNDRIGSVGGGTAILCRSGLDHVLCKIGFLDKDLMEYSACVINGLKVGNKPILVVSIYRPPVSRIGYNRWNNIIHSFENLFNEFEVIICGDLNAQHFSWGSTRPNPEGVHLANILTKSLMIYLNDGSPTRISANINFSSVPDLTLVSPALTGVCSWEAMGSDHLPILITVSNRCTENDKDSRMRPKLILSHFDKETFDKMTKLRFLLEYSSGADMYDAWYNKVMECCLMAGAIKRDEKGNIISYDQ